MVKLRIIYTTYWIAACKTTLKAPLHFFQRLIEQFAHFEEKFAKWRKNNNDEMVFSQNKFPFGY